MYLLDVDTLPLIDNFNARSNVQLFTRGLRPVSQEILVSQPPRTKIFLDPIGTPIRFTKIRPNLSSGIYIIGGFYGEVRRNVV